MSTRYEQGFMAGVAFGYRHANSDQGLQRTLDEAELLLKTASVAAERPKGESDAD